MKYSQINCITVSTANYILNLLVTTYYAWCSNDDYNEQYRQESDAVRYANTFRRFGKSPSMWTYKSSAKVLQNNVDIGDGLGMGFRAS
jgi:hypothetical protein